MSGDQEKERLSGEVIRSDTSAPVLPTVNPATEKPEPPKINIHPSLYVISWITLSSSVILFNKWILDTALFHFPIILTTWHLSFATLMTQILARTTHLLDGRKTVKMTGRIYLRAIVPIGLFFSLSLICGNLTYLYLSVAFIQMLKATMPVATLLASWGIGTQKPNLRVLFNVSFIVLGVIIASIGEIKFVLVGFLFQVGGIVFESIRLVMVERLLSSSEFKMDPLVSLYYFAPVCAIMNGIVSLIFEVPNLRMEDVYHVGLITLFANGCIAFMLNVSVVFLIGKTSSLVLTLCGILKDILLVFASIIIFGTHVSGLQFFGYSIALAGLMYHRFGAEGIKGFFSEGRRRWAEYGAKHPAMRKLIVIAGVMLAIVIILGGLAPTVGYNPQDAASAGKDLYNSIIGDKGTGQVTDAKKGS